LHVFDDIRDSTQLFWGGYATGAVSAVKGMSLDVYYLGLDRKNATFAQGVVGSDGTRLERASSES